jgi:hypothetical protein
MMTICITFITGGMITLGTLSTLATTGLWSFCEFMLGEGYVKGIERREKVGRLVGHVYLNIFVVKLI